MNHALFALVALSIAGLGCEKPAPTPPPETAAQTAEQAEPKSNIALFFSLEPTEEPTDAQKAAAKNFIKLVTEKTGFETSSRFPKSYAQASRTLKKSVSNCPPDQKCMRVTLLSGWAYLHAHHNADGDLLVVDERDGKTQFDSAWFVSADSKIEKLADLKGKRIAFSSPTSAPGFLFPYAKLIEDGIVKQGGDLQKSFKEVYFTGETNALKALTEGKVDAAAAAVFAPELYLAEADRAKVKALATTPGAPTHVLAVRADFNLETKEKLQEVLLALNDSNGAEIKAALGMDKLVKASHGDHMTKLQNAQELVGTEYLVPPEPEPAPAQAPKGLDEPPKKDTKN